MTILEKIFIFLIICINPFKSVAQSELEYRPVIDTFVSNFNSSNFDQVFSHFSNDMKKALPIDRTKEFVVDLKSKVGKILNLRLLKLELLNKNDVRLEYETKCEKVTFVFLFVVESDKKIGGIHIK